MTMKFTDLINLDKVKNLTLENGGLSMTQAVSISNRINQKCEDIEATINNINNGGKTVHLSKDEHYILEQPKEFPVNYLDLINELSELRSIQAYLMESMKIKNDLLDKTRKITLSSKDVENIIKDEFNLTRPIFNEDELKNHVDKPLLKEEDIWSELDEAEYNKYIMEQSKAAALGRVIHKNGQLDTLRKELANMKPLEWIKVKSNEQTPVVVSIHNTMESLLEKHENIASKHNNIEKSVNYIKAKVKDLLNQRNSEIIAENNNNRLISDEFNRELYSNFDKLNKEYHEKIIYVNQEFEKFKLQNLNKISKFKIKIITDIKNILDKYNN